jgi:ParB/RepB/Spo0J family partition protein
MDVPIEKLRPNPWNVNFLTEEKREKLRLEMAKYGTRAVEPLTVREKDGYYEIVNGEQRWSIAKELGWKTIPIEVRNFSDEEAKRLCLGYNMLRGRVDWFKLAEMMKKDSEKKVDPREVYGDLLSREEIDVILALNDLDAKARRLLQRLHMETGTLTLEHLAVIIRFPREYHVELAENLYALKGSGIEELRKVLERYTPAPVGGMKRPETAEETPAEEAEEEMPAPKEPVVPEENEGYEEEEAGLQREEAEEAPKAVKEEAAFFVCECGVQYKADFEKKRIERVKKERGLDIFKVETTLPASIKVKCPRCGAEGTIDVSEEEVEWSLA